MAPLAANLWDQSTAAVFHCALMGSALAFVALNCQFASVYRHVACSSRRAVGTLRASQRCAEIMCSCDCVVARNKHHFPCGIMYYVALRFIAYIM